MKHREGGLVPYLVIPALDLDHTDFCLTVVLSKFPLGAVLLRMARLALALAMHEVYSLGP
jgi:hypothetical protein